MSRRIVSRSAIGVGLSTLVTIMVAVLLTTFSVLTLVSARADLRLSEKAVDSAQGYYAADSTAEQWLAAVDGFVQERRGALAGDFSSTDALSEALASEGYEVGTTADGRVFLTETFTVDGRRNLVVEIALDRTGEIDILRWQTVSRR